MPSMRYRPKKQLQLERIWRSDVSRKATFFLVTGLVLVMVLGGVVFANATIYQSKIVAVKGDPAGDFTNADLNGRYWFRRLEIENVEAPDREAAVAYGHIDFNGSGSFSITFTTFNSDGTTESGSFTGTYSVNSDGSFTFQIEGSPDTITGNISTDPDRSFIVLSDGSASDDDGSYDIVAGIVTAVKAPATQLSVSDLNGTWRFRNLQIHDIEKSYTDVTVCSITFNFNGSGNWDGTYDCFDTDGSSGSGAASGTYKLNLAGDAFDFLIAGEPGVFVSGYLSRDQSTLIFTQGQIESDGSIEQQIATALKINPTKKFTKADLTGRYWYRELAILDMNSISRKASVSNGFIDFGGNGTWSGNYTSFWSDASTESGTNSGTYSVNCDGSFTLTVTSESPNIVFYGNISSDGNTIMLNIPGKDSDVGPCGKAMPGIPLLLLED
jgi:hypothetical protein